MFLLSGQFGGEHAIKPTKQPPIADWNTGDMSLLEDLWARASTSTPVPDATVLVASALVALACVLVAWPAVRMVVTVCHEAGHAVMATLCGRSLKGIRLHSDTSGVTLTRGKPTGAGMVFTLLSGYPAASVVGLAAAAVAGTGHAVAVLWLLVGLLALMLLKIRNVYGAVVVLFLGGVLGAGTWFIPVDVLAWIAYGLAWLLLLAGPRPVIELALSRAGTPSSSDAAQLARLTRIPQVVWIVLWLAVTVATLIIGTALMLPGTIPGLG